MTLRVEEEYRGKYIRDKWFDENVIIQSGDWFITKRASWKPTGWAL